MSGIEVNFMTNSWNLMNFGTPASIPEFSGRSIGESFEGIDQMPGIIFFRWATRESRSPEAVSTT
jgi:hypothetical protein